jgi:hypothetical protein
MPISHNNPKARLAPRGPAWLATFLARGHEKEESSGEYVARARAARAAKPSKKIPAASETSPEARADRSAFSAFSALEPRLGLLPLAAALATELYTRTVDFTTL